MIGRSLLCRWGLRLYRREKFLFNERVKLLPASCVPSSYLHFHLDLQQTLKNCVFIFISSCAHRLQSVPRQNVNKRRQTTQASFPRVDLQNSSSFPLWTFFHDTFCDIQMASLINSYGLGGFLLSAVFQAPFPVSSSVLSTFTVPPSAKTEQIALSLSLLKARCHFLNPITRRRRRNRSRSEPLETNDLEMKEGGIVKKAGRGGEEGKSIHRTQE